MTDRSVATAAASEAVAGIRGMSRLLELYKGSDLARLYEIQTKQKKRLIIGAQPLIPPSPEAMMNMQLQLFEGIEGAKKFIRDTLLIGWWFTRTVAVFDGDMLGELMETDSKDLYVSISQFRKFLGNPVLIPFEKPYEIDDTEIFGCIVGFLKPRIMKRNLHSYCFRSNGKNLAERSPSLSLPQISILLPIMNFPSAFPR